VAGSRRRFLKAGQLIDVWLELEVPDSSTEIFQVVGELLTEGGRVVASSSRACLARYRSPLVKYARSGTRTPAPWFNTRTPAPGFDSRGGIAWLESLACAPPVTTGNCVEPALLFWGTGTGRRRRIREPFRKQVARAVACRQKLRSFVSAVVDPRFRIAPRLLAFAPLYLLGFWEERELLRVQLFNRFREREEEPFTVFRGLLQGHANGGLPPQLYSAQLHVLLRLGVVSKLLYLVGLRLPVA
jgi:Putative adipose-regulatory protein (Seipin)